MTPTYGGRVQTRFFTLLVIGGIWTLILMPFLSLTKPNGMSASLGEKYQAGFIVLALVFILGLVWDGIWYFLQQFRWEKDWPIMYQLLTGIPEGIAVWLVLKTRDVPGHPFLTGTVYDIQFITVWIFTWLFAIGPMRVPFLRWRFRGGRLV
ncbi:MAG: hypothetical protein ACRDZ8_10185 [Acidimicrobiales bacterium]